MSYLSVISESNIVHQMMDLVESCPDCNTKGVWFRFEVLLRCEFGDKVIGGEVTYMFIGDDLLGNIEARENSSHNTNVCF